MVIHHIMRLRIVGAITLREVRKEVGEGVALTDSERNMLKLGLRRFLPGIDGFVGSVLEVIGKRADEQCLPTVCRSSDLASLLMTRTVYYNDYKLIGRHDLSSGAVQYLNDHIPSERFNPILFSQGDIAVLAELDDLFQRMFIAQSVAHQVSLGSFLSTPVPGLIKDETYNYWLSISKEDAGINMTKVMIQLTRKRGNLSPFEMSVIRRYGFSLWMQDEGIHFSFGPFDLAQEDEESHVAASCYWIVDRENPVQRTDAFPKTTRFIPLHPIDLLFLKEQEVT